MNSTRRPHTAQTEVVRQLRIAQAREDRDRRHGRRARAARYDRKSHRLILELTNGCLFGFPVYAIPALANLDADELATVALSPAGSGLRWEALDIDLDIPGLLMSSIGRSERLSELARLAGSAKSHAKAAAARRNGRKGGRPPKTARRRK